LPQAGPAVFFRLLTDYRYLAPMFIRYFLDFQARFGAVPFCFGEQCVKIGNDRESAESIFIYLYQDFNNYAAFFASQGSVCCGLETDIFLRKPAILISNTAKLLMVHRAWVACWLRTRTVSIPV
jgi:hypothetical protein